MKVRIMEKNGCFFPQYRWFYFWLPFEEKLGHKMWEVKRDSLRQAEDYVCAQQIKRNPKTLVKEFEI